MEDAPPNAKTGKGKERRRRGSQDAKAGGKGGATEGDGGKGAKKTRSKNRRRRPSKKNVLNATDTADPSVTTARGATVDAAPPVERPGEAANADGDDTLAAADEVTPPSAQTVAGSGPASCDENGAAPAKQVDWVDVVQGGASAKARETTTAKGEAALEVERAQVDVEGIDVIGEAEDEPEDAHAAANGEAANGGVDSTPHQEARSTGDAGDAEVPAGATSFGDDFFAAFAGGAHGEDEDETAPAGEVDEGEGSLGAPKTLSDGGVATLADEDFDALGSDERAQDAPEEGGAGSIVEPESTAVAQNTSFGDDYFAAFNAGDDEEEEDKESAGKGGGVREAHEPEVATASGPATPVVTAETAGEVPEQAGTSALQQRESVAEASVGLEKVPRASPSIPSEAPPPTTRSSKPTVSNWRTGTKVATVFGRGRVVAVRPDGIVHVALMSWVLAQDAKVQLFLQPDAVELLPPSVGDEVSTIYGRGDLEKLRSDGSCVVRLSSWRLAGDSRPICYLRSLDEVKPAAPRSLNIEEKLGRILELREEGKQRFVSGNVESAVGKFAECLRLLTSLQGPNQSELGVSQRARTLASWIPVCLMMARCAYKQESYKQAAGHAQNAYELASVLRDSPDTPVFRSILRVVQPEGPPSAAAATPLGRWPLSALIVKAKAQLKLGEGAGAEATCQLGAAVDSAHADPKQRDELAKLQKRARDKVKGERKREADVARRMFGGGKREVAGDLGGAGDKEVATDDDEGDFATGVEGETDEWWESTGVWEQVAFGVGVGAALAALAWAVVRARAKN